MQLAYSPARRKSIWPVDLHSISRQMAIPAVFSHVGVRTMCAGQECAGRGALVWKRLSETKSPT